MLYRIYLGPFAVGKIDLTYHKGKIKRGQKIRVTPEEAAAMDKLPKQWRDPVSEKKTVAANVMKATVSAKAEKPKEKRRDRPTPIETVTTVKRKRKRRKGGK